MLADFLVPFLPMLVKSGDLPAEVDPGAWGTASALWEIIRKEYEGREAAEYAALYPYDEDLPGVLRSILHEFLSRSPGGKEELERMRKAVETHTAAHTGRILSGENDAHSLTALNENDPILRRLEMIRLLRSGVPAQVVAEKFCAVADYVLKLDELFSKAGAAGILTEDDIQNFSALHPDAVRICAFNLHGTHTGGRFRLKRIARELSLRDPDLCAFQEVISGGGIEETSGSITQWMTRMSGRRYLTHFAYCHPFMDVYPEGVSVASNREFANRRILDLNKNLRNDLHPTMERFSAAAEVEIRGRRIVFVSVHLDHAGNRDVRHAQAEKLLAEISRFYTGEYRCIILAGDFNDTEDSPVMNFLRGKGYRDAWRCCREEKGDTFSLPNPFTRIDYIMVKGEVRFLSADLILDNAEFSDHRGVFAVIQ